jgi:hypothetical protein
MVALSAAVAMPGADDVRMAAKATMKPKTFTANPDFAMADPSGGEWRGFVDGRTFTYKI